MTTGLPRLVVLISGSGSNLQALIDGCAAHRIPGQIVAVISNRPAAGGLERAALANITHRTLDHRQFANREQFDDALGLLVASFKPDLVILAGFMRILTDAFVSQLYGRLMNIHPSLLPRYPGLHTHQRAIDNGDSEAGATVHFVTPELDGGPAIVQTRVPVLPGDTAATLAARVLEQEHHIYPLAVRWFCEDRLQLRADGVYLDGKPLPQSGYSYTGDDDH